MRKLDNKQKIQVVVLALLAIGLFSSFIVQMVHVTPAAAKEVASGPTETTSSTGAPRALSAAGRAAAAAAAVIAADAPAPTPTMRDPFVPGFADPNILLAYQKSLDPPKPNQTSGDWNKPHDSAPSTFVAPLPKPGDGLTIPGGRDASLTVAPLPKPAVEDIPAPAWTVTGVVGGDDGRLAILRDGDSRRMVRSGDMLDANYRVIGVDGSRVTLAHGSSHYTLVLGAKPVDPAPATPAMSMPQANTPQDLGAPATPVTGAPNGTVNPSGTQINPNALIKLPGGITLPSVGLPSN